MQRKTIPIRSETKTNNVRNETKSNNGRLTRARRAAGEDRFRPRQEPIRRNVRSGKESIKSEEIKI